LGKWVMTLTAPENIEAVGDAGLLYDNEQDLAYKLQRVLRDGSLVHAYRQRAQARVRQHYDWDRVVDQYEELFARMAGLERVPRIIPVANPQLQTTTLVGVGAANAVTA